MNPSSTSSSNKKYLFLEEPVEEWSKIKDREGKTILEKFYNNQEKYSFSFQMLAYISRLADLKNAVKYHSSFDFKMNNVAFSIEGNIGTGKSTLIKNLQTHFKCEKFNKQAYNNSYDVIMTERSLYSDCNIFAQMLFDDGKIEDVEFAIYKKWFNEFMEDLPTMAFIYIRADPKVSFDRVEKRAREGEKSIPLNYIENCHRYHENWLMADTVSITVSNTGSNTGSNTATSKKHDLLVIDANEDINENPELLASWIKQIEDFIESIHHRRNEEMLQEVNEDLMEEDNDSGLFGGNEFCSECGYNNICRCICGMNYCSYCNLDGLCDNC